ncbi:hypothetical protein MHU86_25945 [Fragilaria crotonensis]|nr:hypothetical protein MHU86_25945 [Fragilaria crotonensis]
MTMTAQAALPSPPDPAAYHDPHHPMYGFYTEEWHDQPSPPNGSKWFPDEERYRREANAHAYRQHGTPQNWLRYLTLGYFVYDDCSKFDALWMKYSADPIICHRMVWYNFLYHVDRNYELPPTLSAWATDVSQPYLQRYAPQFLALNTMEHTWNDHIRGDHDAMDIEMNKWTQVGTKKKALRHQDPAHNANARHEVPPSPRNGPDIMTDEQLHTKTNSDPTNMSETSSVGKQSALQMDLNVPTNDGTNRLTFRWTPREDFKQYNDKSTTWLKEVHQLFTELFSDSDCSFYRWESVDLTMSRVMSEISPGELREFLSPNVTFLPSTSQIVFGARVCFASKYPGQWKNKECTRQTMTENQLSVTISNSTTKSGRIVTAGFILFKAARTTHRTRYLQSLRMHLPSDTPFFDILQFTRTPMEQRINHLVVQCGENHVTTLSKALSELLTGHNSPLYLSRLALANLSPAQISSYFEMQDKYSKSLKSLNLFPTLANLDKPRKEYFDDGTILERSTRDWAATLFTDRSDIGARCEVVNGGFDQKAYLLVPSPYFSVAQEYLRQYRLRINPIGRREARFRDSLPGLPSVIHIDTSTQQNLDFLSNMSSHDIWKSAPPEVRQASPNINPSPHQGAHPNRSLHNEISNTSHSGANQGSNTPKLSSQGESGDKSGSHQIAQEQDDQTTSTKSASQSMTTRSLISTATSRRLNELEAMFRSQQTAIAENSQLSKRTDSTLQQTIHTLQDNSTKLVLTMERQQDTHVQLVELSTRVSHLTEVMDKMASQLETLTNLTFTQPHKQQDQGWAGTRRRSIEEMSSNDRSDLSSIRPSSLQASGSDFESQDDKSTNKHRDQVQSPNKKKSRQHTHEMSRRTLQSDLEEMSLGSDGYDHSSTFTPRELPPPNRPSRLDVQKDGGLLLDDSSEDFSTTTDAMPDLDTQYNSHSEPEGGDSS